MNLPKFKNFISNMIVHSLFDYFNIYEENVYSNDSSFSVLPFDNNNFNEKNIAHTMRQYKKMQSVVNTFSKSPLAEDILNNDFSFVIHFDGHNVGTGISLEQLNNISTLLHTNLIFVNGDGNDYQLGEYTGGHDSEVILHVHFVGHKDKLIADYQQWYHQRHDYLSKKIEEKNNAIKLK